MKKVKSICVSCGKMTFSTNNICSECEEPHNDICDFCHKPIKNFTDGTIYGWMCDKCGNVFCATCLDKLAKRNESGFNAMLYSDETLCPDCW